MKASVFIATSLDGFIARENGDIDWLEGSGDQPKPNADQEDYGYESFMESVDVLVLGRISYEKVLSFGEWPYGKKRVIVLSSTLTVLSDDTPETVELRNCSPAELSSELQDSGEENLYIDGGKTIQGFLEAGLIDEIIITKIPVLIGSGIPLFGSLRNDKKLRHLDTISFKNGFVQSRYEVVK